MKIDCSARVIIFRKIRQKMEQNILSLHNAPFPAVHQCFFICSDEVFVIKYHNMSQSHCVILAETYRLVFCVTQTVKSTNRYNAQVCSAYEKLQPEQCDVQIQTISLKMVRDMKGGEFNQSLKKDLKIWELVMWSVLQRHGER